MQYLVVIRVVSGLLGITFALWSFVQFRKRLIKRYEFFLLAILGTGLFTTAVYPDSINIVAGMMAMDNRQYGRLISLLILSNMLLWLLVISQRTKDSIKSIQFDLLVRRIAMERFFEKDAAKTIKEITVIIPALNEAENLDHLLPRMPESIMGHPLGVLVIDDGSVDDTVDVVKKHGCSVVSNPINRGGGAALRLGYDIAMASGVKFIVTMDADGQHIPGEIERLVAPILDGAIDIVIGSRVLGRREKDSVFRWIGIHVFNVIVNILAGTRITDCSNGFRAFRMDSLKKVLLLQDQFHTAELIIDAAGKGMRIGEAPVTVLRRRSGESKKGKNLSYGLNFSKTILKAWLRK
ncbi:MAG TPA: glycosyltransferase family 2 protein [Nitrospirae bacterium]|nr:glycosyltransferase family 2 protein [Nitrospirota bacterium]